MKINAKKLEKEESSGFEYNCPYCKEKTWTSEDPDLKTIKCACGKKSIVKKYVSYYVYTRTKYKKAILTKP